MSKHYITVLILTICSFGFGMITDKIHNETFDCTKNIINCFDIEHMNISDYNKNNKNNKNNKKIIGIALLFDNILCNVDYTNCSCISCRFTNEHKTIDEQKFRYCNMLANVHKIPTINLIIDYIKPLDYNISSSTNGNMLETAFIIRNSIIELILRIIYFCSTILFLISGYIILFANYYKKTKHYHCSSS